METTTRKDAMMDDLPMRLQVALDMAGSYYRSGRYDDAMAVLSTVTGADAARTAVITCPECGYVALADIPAPESAQGPDEHSGASEMTLVLAERMEAVAADFVQCLSSISGAIAHERAVEAVRLLENGARRIRYIYGGLQASREACGILAEAAHLAPTPATGAEGGEAALTEGERDG